MNFRFSSIAAAGAMLVAGAGFTAAQAQDVYGNGYYYGGAYDQTYYDPGYYNGGYYNDGWNGGPFTPLFAPVAIAAGIFGAAANVVTSPFTGGYGYYEGPGYVDAGYGGRGSYGNGYPDENRGRVRQAYQAEHGYGYGRRAGYVATYRGRPQAMQHVMHAKPRAMHHAQAPTTGRKHVSMAQ